MTALTLPVQTFGLLALSNVFMTFAWYGHLKNLGTRVWCIAALCLVGAVYFIFRA